MLESAAIENSCSYLDLFNVNFADIINCEPMMYNTKKMNEYKFLFRNTGTTTSCLNLGSYNYLGFAEKSGPCAEAAIESLYHYGAGTNNSRRDLGIKTSGKEVAMFL